MRHSGGAIARTLAKLPGRRIFAFGRNSPIVIFEVQATGRADPNPAVESVAHRHTLSMRRSIWMDLSEPVDRIPDAGDYIVTRGKRGWGSAYLITACREVRRVHRKTPERRFALSVQPGYPIEEALRFAPWILHWYSREPRRRAA